MNTPAMEAIHDRLKTLAPSGVERNNATEYIAFQIRTPKGKRNVVTISRAEVTFSTENVSLLKGLQESGVALEKIEPDEGRNKSRYRFPVLELATIDAHLEQFRKLFEESVAVRRHYS